MKIKLLLSLLAVTASAAADDNRSRPGPPKTNMMQAISNAGVPPSWGDTSLLKQMVDDLMKEKEQLKHNLGQAEDRLTKAIDEIRDLKDVNTRSENDLVTLSNMIRNNNDTMQRLRQERDDFRRTVEYPGSMFNGWVFSEEFGWVFTSPTVAPYAFLAENNEWVCYEQGTGLVDGRLIFKFRTNEWVDLDKND